MSSYKFRIDQPEPPEENINRHKDFKRLHGNYERMTKPLYKTPLYKNPRVFLIIVLILIIAWLIAEFGGEDAQKKNPKDSVKKDTVQTLKPG